MSDRTDISPSLAGLCAAPDCEKSVRSRYASYCEAHYYRLRRGSRLGLSPVKMGCIHCGKPLTGTQSRYCSTRCGWRYYQDFDNERRCGNCGKPFDWRGTQAFCSPECKRRARMDRRQQRRARIYERPREFFTSLEIYERDGWTCQLCGKKTLRREGVPHPLAPTIDHIIPIARGGSHTRINVQCAHFQCNVRKHARPRGQLRLFG